MAETETPTCLDGTLVTIRILYINEIVTDEQIAQSKKDLKLQKNPPALHFIFNTDKVGIRNHCSYKYFGTNSQVLSILVLWILEVGFKDALKIEIRRCLPKSA